MLYTHCTKLYIVGSIHPNDCLNISFLAIENVDSFFQTSKINTIQIMTLTIDLLLKSKMNKNGNMYFN